MFAAYEDEFGELASEIGQKLKKVEAEPMTRDDAEEAMDEVDGLLTELRTVTRSMEMGKRDVPSAARAACERRLAEYQKDLERLGAETRRVRRAATAKQGRQELLGGGGGGYEMSDEARRRSEDTRTLLDVAERGRSSLQRVRAHLIPPAGPYAPLVGWPCDSLGMPRRRCCCAECRARCLYATVDGATGSDHQPGRCHDRDASRTAREA